MMLRSCTHVCLVVIAFAVANVASAAELVLADDGKSDYQIVIADNASPRPGTAPKNCKHSLPDDRREAADRFRSEADGPVRDHPRRQRPFAGTRCEHRFQVARFRRICNSHRRPALGDCRRAVAGQHVRRVRFVGRSLGLPLVRPGRKPHSKIRAAGRRRDRRSASAGAGIPRALRRRVLRRRLVCAEPHEFQRRPAGSEARRQSEGWSLAHSFATLVPPEKYFKRPSGILLVGRRPAHGRMRNSAAPIRR